MDGCNLVSLRYTVALVAHWALNGQLGQKRMSVPGLRHIADLALIGSGSD